jgi:O-acetyl-ADP-ribose deacetylase (regulator of RNase III)
MPFQIIRNDITKVKADAIVNTANPHPIIGSGTDSAIHESAGPELLNARTKIGDILPGAAVSTPAFNLPAKYVIHTVGPSWVDGKHGEETVLRRACTNLRQVHAG